MELTEEADTSTFVDFFSGTAFIKVLDYLLEEQMFDLSKKEIADGSGIGENTLHTLWPRLEKYDLVEQTRKNGKGYRYVLNKANPLVKDLRRIDFRLIKQAAPKNEEQLS